MRKRSIRIAAGGVLAVAVSAAIAAVGAPPAPTTAALTELGHAYAEAYGLKLDQVEARAVDLGADKLIAALAVGYTAAPGQLRMVPLAQLGQLGTLTMAGDRTAEQVVRQLVTPGRAVIEVTWSFTGVEPVQTYAIVDTDGEPLFDTLLSLPVVPGPIFTPGHF